MDLVLSNSAADSNFSVYLGSGLHVVEMEYKKFKSLSKDTAPNVDSL
jgi:hypothetical protein